MDTMGLWAAMQTGFTGDNRLPCLRSSENPRCGIRRLLVPKEIRAGITSHPADHSSVMPITDFGDLLRSQFPSQAGEVHPSLPFLNQSEDMSCWALGNY